MRVGSVAAGFVQNFIDFAELKGVSGDVLLSNAGLTPNDLVDQDARVPLDTYIKLVRDAVKLTNDPALPLRVSTETRIENISIVGLVIHSSKSMPDSMEQLNRYSKLMVEVDVMSGEERFSIIEDRGGIWIVDNRPNPNLYPELTETSFGWFIGEFRRHFPDRSFGVQIEVTHKQPEHAQSYDEIFRIPTHFEADRNAMEIDPIWLTTDFVAETSYVFGVFAERADALMKKLETQTSMRGRIEAYVMTNLHRGEIGIEEVAAEMGMSRQTLYRRLRDEDATFVKIHDELRHRMAVDYISARKVSVNQTAYLVGFSEPSPFIRAFRRWTGQTPAEYRLLAT